MDLDRNIPDTPGYYWCRDPYETVPTWRVVCIQDRSAGTSEVWEFDLESGTAQIPHELRQILARFEWDGPLPEPGCEEPF